MKPVKVGVIGVGRMGQRHCRIYSNMRKVDLIGVCDDEPQIGTQIAQQYEVPYYRDFNELITQVDAISIATPTPLHFYHARAAINLGVNVLIEKPISENLQQAKELVDYADDCNVIVQIGHIERFNPAYIELKNVLENLSPIAINFLRLSPFKGSNKDVDVVLDLMIHDTNLIYDLLAEDPIIINPNGAIVFSDKVDHAIATMNFEKGPLVTVTASRVTEHKVRLIEVTAREAYVRCDLLNKNISIRRSTIGKYLNQSQPGVKYHQESFVEWISVPPYEPLLLQLEHFIESIITRNKPLVSARDGYNALRLAINIRDSIEEKLGERDKLVYSALPD